MIAPPILPWITKTFFFKRILMFLPNQPTNQPDQPVNLGSKRRSTGSAFRRQKNDVSDPIVVTRLGRLGFGGRNLSEKKNTHTHTHLLWMCFWNPDRKSWDFFVASRYSTYPIFYDRFYLYPCWLSQPLVRLDHFPPSRAGNKKHIETT